MANTREGSPEMDEKAHLDEWKKMYKAKKEKQRTPEEEKLIDGFLEEERSDN